MNKIDKLEIVADNFFKNDIDLDTFIEKMTKKNYEKLELAMNTYKLVLEEKVANKHEWEMVQRIARRKNVNLKKHTITLTI